MLAKPNHQKVSYTTGLLGFWPFLHDLAGPWVYLLGTPRDLLKVRLDHAFTLPSLMEMDVWHLWQKRGVTSGFSVHLTAGSGMQQLVKQIDILSYNPLLVRLKELGKV